MASVLSAPFSVRAGSAISGDAAARRAIPGLRRRLSDTERRLAAIRLRRDGWSYHRIAEALEMRYSLVAAVADGDAGAVPSITVRHPADAGPDPAISKEAPDTTSRKLDELIAAVARQGDAVARLEANLPRVIEAAHATLAERLMHSVRALLDRVLPQGGPAEADQTADPA